MAEDIGFTLRIEGLEQVKSKLQELAARLPKEADAIIEDGAEKAFAMSQGLCPVDTGTLLASGSHNHQWLHSEVGYSAPYAAFVEYGTSMMGAQPYLFPTIEIAISYVSDRLGKLAQA